MPRPKKINGVTVTGTFHEALLLDTDAIEEHARELRAELEMRAAIDHPIEAYRAAPGDLRGALNSQSSCGYDPQGYPQGWTGPRTVDENWTPRTWTERQAARAQTTPAATRTRRVR